MAPRNKEILLTEGEHSGPGEVRYKIDICGKGFDVFFRSAHAPLYSGVEPALPLALLGAMRTGSDIRVLSPISATYVRNIQKIITIFSDWFSRFARVTVYAERPVVPTPAPTGRVGLFFSGGVDSFYTLLCNAREITDLVYIHGFDVRLDDLPRRKAVSETGLAVAEETGTRFIEIESNLGKIVQEYGLWVEHGYGMALGAVGRLLQGYLDRVYVAAGTAYQDLAPNGSHPATDPLYGDEVLTFIHHGAEATRTEKTEVISSSPLAMRFLRVCVEHPKGRLNCGECEKCLRTMVALHSLGALERSDTFPREIDIAKLRDLTTWEPHLRRFLVENLRLLEGKGLRETELYEVLDRIGRRPPWLVKRLQRYRRKWRKMANKIDRVFSREPRRNTSRYV